MKVGTPGFVGQRLREAREARGLTASSFAELLGVTRSAVSQYELGIQSPRAEVLERACRILNLSAGYFLAHHEQASFRVIFYRSMSADTKLARLRADRRIQWLRSITAYLKCFVEMPALNLPRLAFPRDPKRISNGDIERAALQTRKLWGIGDAPISNLVRTAENNGIVVAVDELGADALKAVTALDEADSFVLLATNLVAAESRYELARQIGHLVLHETVLQQQLATNNDFGVLREQASRFAAALLLPEPSYRDDLYAFSVDAMRILKQKWKVPIGVMITRLEHLGAINPDQAKRLWISKSRRGWSASAEPLDEELPLEKPRLLSESVDLLVSEQILSKAEILGAIPLSDRDIELLTALPQGYLTDTMPVITIIAPKQGRLQLSIGETAPVIKFPDKPRPSNPTRRRARKG